MDLPAPIIPAAEVAIMDHAAESLGVDISELMQRAGEAIARATQELAPRGPILVACGPGNNGGDGYVAARLLAEAGREVWCWAVSDPRSVLCDREAGRLPDTVRRIAGTTPQDIPALIVDAVLGAGVRGALRGAAKEALAQLRALGAPCLAVDLPTGLASREHITPCHCCCLQAAKQEVVASRDCAVSVADIGIPEAAWQEVGPSCFKRFPLHHSDAHKGGHGSLAVIAGWAFPGAAWLSCRAALASGCDLVHAWMPADVDLPVPVVHHCLQRGSQDSAALRRVMETCDAVLLGPGLGRDATAGELAQQVWELAMHCRKPLVIDADGLHLLAEQIRSDERPELLLTPHAGELAAICGQRVEATEAHAFARPDRVLLAKGRRDLISDGLQWQYNLLGNPRMAVGGSGDCLTGLAAGLCARDCSGFDAARLAAHWLCSAADRCWRELGPCYEPEHIIDALPATLRELLAQADMPWPPVAEETS